MLKLKFKKLQGAVVENVNAADVIEFLLEEEVIGNEDIPKVMVTGNPRVQCRSLLGLLESSQHPQAYVKLYMAIKEESDLQWLVDRFEETYISAGFTIFFFNSILNKLYFVYGVSRYFSFVLNCRAWL